MKVHREAVRADERMGKSGEKAAYNAAGAAARKRGQVKGAGKWERRNAYERSSGKTR